MIGPRERLYTGGEVFGSVHLDRCCRPYRSDRPIRAFNLLDGALASDRAVRTGEVVLHPFIAAPWLSSRDARVGLDAVLVGGEVPPTSVAASDVPAENPYTLRILATRGIAGDSCGIFDNHRKAPRWRERVIGWAVCRVETHIIMCSRRKRGVGILPRLVERHEDWIANTPTAGLNLQALRVAVRRFPEPNADLIHGLVERDRVVARLQGAAHSSSSTPTLQLSLEFMSARTVA